MADPFVSLVASMPTQQEKIARSTNPFDHTCSVTMLGDVRDLEAWSGPVGRQLVTIGFLEEHSGLSEEALQRTLGALVDELAPSGDTNFVPFVAVLERSRAGACYTILCCCRDQPELERFDWASHTIFEHLLSENGLAPDCLRVATMNVSGVEEVTHLLLRTAGRDDKLHKRVHRGA
jgi:hypothetical protein